MPVSMRVTGAEPNWVAVNGAADMQNAPHLMWRFNKATRAQIRCDAAIDGHCSLTRGSASLFLSAGERNRCGFDPPRKRTLLCLLRFRLGGFLPKSPGVQRDVSAQVPARRVGQFANYDLFSGDKL